MTPHAAQISFKWFTSLMIKKNVILITLRVFISHIKHFIKLTLNTFLSFSSHSSWISLWNHFFFSLFLFILHRSYVQIPKLTIQPFSVFIHRLLEDKVFAVAFDDIVIHKVSLHNLLNHNFYGKIIWKHEKKEKKKNMLFIFKEV